MNVKLLGGYGNSILKDDKQFHQYLRVYDADYIATTLCTKSNPFYQFNGQKRRLTEREAFRVMGFAPIKEDGTFDDSAYERAAKVTSPTSLIKQTGNSICVNVLEEIFKELL